MFFIGLQTAQAGGFQIPEMATRAAGMGSAFTAVSDDASAAWFNPAGVAFTEGSQVMIGGDALIIAGTKYNSNAATKGLGGAQITSAVNAKDQVFFVPHTYYTYMSDAGLGAAISINAPFGLETDWPTTAPFSSKNTFSRIQMIMVNPSVVFKLNNNFSIAAGVDYAYLNNVDLNNTLQNLNGNGDGWGGNVSMLYRDDAFSFGVTYRSQIKVNIDGTALAKSALAAAGVSAAKTQVTLPDQVNVGLAYKASDALLLSADVDWVNWKTFDAINISFASATYRAVLKGLQGAIGAPATGSANLPQNWKATVAFRLGAEWSLTPDMRLRGGYVFDPTPIKDVDFNPGIPGEDRHVFSLGYGYDFNENTTVDLAYAYVYFKKRYQTTSPATPPGSPNSVKNGTYKTDVHILAASLSYKF